MTRIERIVTICDLHADDTPGRRVLFVVASRIYWLDTCPQHRADLQAAVALVERAIVIASANMTPIHHKRPRYIRR